MNKLIVVLFLISVFLASFIPVKDTDFGWHYRCGQQFLTTGNPLANGCLKNEFSYFLPDYQAYYPSFLYDIGLAFVYNHFGFIGISFLGAAIFTLCAFFIFRFLSGPSWLRILAFYTIWLLSYSTFGLGLRSQIVSFLFFAVTLFIINKAKNNFGWLFLLPLIFVVWVNTHIGFFIGLVLLVFFTAESVINLRGFSDTIWNRGGLILVSVFIFSILSTFINPFGPKVYLEIFRHLQAPLSTMIAEWVAPDFWQTTLIIILIIIGLVIGFKNKSISLFKILILLSFGFLAVKARRNLPFFYIIFFYTTLSSKLTNNFLKYLGHDHDQDKVINQLSLSFLVSLIFVFSVINIPQTLNFHQSWENYCRQGPISYPCQAIEKTNLKQLSGNLFTAYEWGGFLIWQTPKLKVFADGRMSAWKDENNQYPYQVYLYIIQAKSGWNEMLKKYKTDYLLIGKGTFLDLELQKNAAKYGWKESYRDDVAVFYQKT